MKLIRARSPLALVTVWQVAALVALPGCTSIQPDRNAFIGTHWRVTAINGQATPTGSGYHMQFQHFQWFAGFGCNGMSAEHRLSNNQLSVGRTENNRFYIGRIMATERDCSNRSSSHFESQAIVILRQPMTVRFRDGRHLSLTNVAGSFLLERLP